MIVIMIFIIISAKISFIYLTNFQFLQNFFQNFSLLNQYLLHQITKAILYANYLI